jgi:protease-4
MYSMRQQFTDDERDRLAAMLDRVYAEFVQKVADGRGMALGDVDAVARGRIWSGRDAADRGLVDRLGGLRTAAEIARDRAGLGTDAPVRAALHLPLHARLGRATSSEDPRAAAAVVSGWGDLAGLAAALGLPLAGPLRMPDVRLG